MASKQVTDREKAGRAVAAAADTHAAEIARGFAQELTPHLKAGEALPDVALLARLIARKITAENAALVRADAAHERELADDAAPREARDEAAAHVRAALVDGRSAVDSTFGAQGLRLLHLDRAIPEDPSVLATTAETVAGALRDDRVKLAKPRRASMKLDRKALADEITSDLAALKKALAKVATEEREKEATLRAKQSAVTGSDRAFTRGAALLSASCAFAGLDDLAAKVRPSGRRPGRTAQEDAEEAAEPGPAGGDAGG